MSSENIISINNKVKQVLSDDKITLSISEAFSQLKDENPFLKEIKGVKLAESLFFNGALYMFSVMRDISERKESITPQEQSKYVEVIESSFESQLGAYLYGNKKTKESTNSREDGNNGDDPSRESPTNV